MVRSPCHSTWIHRSPRHGGRPGAPCSSPSVACGYLECSAQRDIQGSSRAIFSSSIIVTLLSNYIGAKDKILFEKRSMPLKETVEDSRSSPAPSMSLSVTSSEAASSWGPSSNMELTTLPYLVVCYVKQKSASLTLLPVCPSSAFQRQTEIV